MRSDFSPRMLRAFFTPDSPENIITLLKIYGEYLEEPIYLCDGYTKRLDALTTDDEVIYGLTSEGIDHIFLPFEFPMPSDDGADGARTTLTIYNATGAITSLIRTLPGPPKVRIQLVLQGATEASNGTDVSLPEMTIDNLELGGISYKDEAVTGHLSVDTRMGEPFPCHTMTPSHCPGLF